MVTHDFSKIVGYTAAALLVVSLAGCGGGKPSGVYKAKGQAIFEQFDFQSGDKVAVTAFGQVVPGDYVVLDSGLIKVMASNGGVATLKKADDGCLELSAGSEEEAAAAAREGINPGDFGRFCKD